VRTPAKAFIISLISAVTFSFAVAPTATADTRSDFSFEAEVAAVQPDNASQSLDAGANSIETKSLDTLLEMNGATTLPHGFDVDAAIRAAQAEIGTSRATGWGMPGECIVSAFRWLAAGGADLSQVGTNPVDSYRSATRLTMEYAQPGDIVQYEHTLYPTSWVSGVHTVLITAVNGDGTYTIIESNVPGGSGLVSQVDNWTPAPPSGFIAVVWRF